MLTGIKDGSDIRPTKAQGVPEEKWVRQSNAEGKTRGTQITPIHLNELLANIRHIIKEKLRVGMKIDGQTDAQIAEAIKFNENKILHWILRGYTGTLSVDLPNTLDEVNKGPGDYVAHGGDFVVITDKTTNTFGLRHLDDIVAPINTETLWERPTFDFNVPNQHNDFGGGGDATDSGPIPFTDIPFRFLSTGGVSFSGRRKDWTTYDMLAFFITSLDSDRSRTKRTASPIIVYVRGGSHEFAGEHGSDFDFYAQDDSADIRTRVTGRDPIRFQGGKIERLRFDDSSQPDNKGATFVPENTGLYVTYSPGATEYLYKVVGIKENL